MSRYEAVIFDLGGVVLDSPLPAIARFEAQQGIPSGFINRTVAAAGSGGAWARHERGEIDRQRFLAEFASELEREGHRVDTGTLMKAVESSMRPRPRMLAAVRRLRLEGYRVAALTNNWSPLGGTYWAAYFDVFCESVVEGVRKPEPEIYRRCLGRLEVRPEEAVMLDDLGVNLKPAREMGITTIKVISEDQALRDLDRVLNG